MTLQINQEAKRQIGKTPLNLCASEPRQLQYNNIGLLF